MGQISLMQYKHPRGEGEQVTVELPDEVCVMAQRQVLSCECSPHDYSKVILYSHPVGVDPDEEQEHVLIAENGPGEKSPPVVLERLIREVDAQIES